MFRWDQERDDPDVSRTEKKQGVPGPKREDRSMRKLAMFVVACCLAYIAHSPEFLEAHHAQGGDYRECISLCSNANRNCVIDCEGMDYPDYNCIQQRVLDLDYCEYDKDHKHYHCEPIAISFYLQSCTQTQDEFDCVNECNDAVATCDASCNELL